MGRVQDGGHAERGRRTPSLSGASSAGTVGRGESSDGREVPPEKNGLTLSEGIIIFYRLHEVPKVILEVMLLIFGQYAVL